MAKLRANPETASYLAQPDFAAMLKMVQSNPSMLGQLIQDKRFAKALEVGMGMKLGFGDGDDGFGASSAGDGDGPGLAGSSGAAAREAPKPAPAPEPEPELTEEERAEKEQKEHALEVRCETPRVQGGSNWAFKELLQGFALIGCVQEGIAVFRSEPLAYHALLMGILLH